MNDESLLTADELAGRILHISKRQLWRLRDCGALPMPIRIGGTERCLRWRAEIINQWIADGMPDVRRTGWTPSDGGNKR